MEYQRNRNVYTVWNWVEAPVGIRTQAPKEWEDKGAWVMKIEPGHGFPYTEFPVHNRPELEVSQQKIDGSWYAFIKDPRKVPYPPITIEGFEFGVLPPSPYSSHPISKIDGLLDALDTKVDGPSIK